MPKPLPPIEVVDDPRGHTPMNDREIYYVEWITPRGRNDRGMAPFYDLNTARLAAGRKRAQGYTGVRLFRTWGA